MDFLRKSSAKEHILQGERCLLKLVFRVPRAELQKESPLKRIASTLRTLAVPYSSNILLIKNNIINILFGILRDYTFFL